jgi:hypothetical protein
VPILLTRSACFSVVSAIRKERTRGQADVFNQLLGVLGALVCPFLRSLVRVRKSLVVRGELRVHPLPQLFQFLLASLVSRFEVSIRCLSSRLQIAIEGAVGVG